MLRAVNFFLNHSIASNNRTMKIGRTALTAAVLSISTSSFHQSQAFTVARPALVHRTNGHGIVSLASAATMAEAEETYTKQTPSNLGKPVAEGTVVSFYRGGLVAIRVSDEITQQEPATSSSNTGVESTTGVFGTAALPTKDVSGASQGNDIVGKHCIFPNGSVGVVVAQRFPLAFVLTDMDQMENNDGVVSVLDSLATVSTGARMMDYLGRPICDSDGDQETSSYKRPMIAPIPQVKDIALINSPLLTGTTMVDALAPIGKGQNMLVVGHDINMMRGFASDFFSTQVASGATKLVYGLTNAQDRQKIIDQFREAGILDQVTIVSASVSDKDEVARAAEAVAVAATACAIGEAYALSEGEDALVLIDNIDQHKVLWDATTRVLMDIYGADAVVMDDQKGAASSEMRAFYSSLIQRAAKYKKSRGDGSLTLTMLTTVPSMHGSTTDDVFELSDFEGSSEKVRARLDILLKKNIPLTAATLRKIDIPIPSVSEGERRFVLQHVDDLISMSDGQIWLDEGLADIGQTPPLDPQRSITRVGIGADTVSRADSPAVRRVVGGLRLDLAQALSMDGAKATTASEKQIRKQRAWLLAMHQEAGKGGRSLGESCIALLAASKGALDDTIDAGHLAGTEAGNAVIQDLLNHVKKAVPDALEEVNKTFDMSAETKKDLEDAIDSFFDQP
mmetsp:Transcript_18096/g.25499  ORF Transcript_18096/g.25499 Transcript_18096/m.25499 type:complete len:679 (+) Transcript_18096:132-2168(+)